MSPLKGLPGAGDALIARLKDENQALKREAAAREAKLQANIRYVAYRMSYFMTHIRSNMYRMFAYLIDYLILQMEFQGQFEHFGPPS